MANDDLFIAIKNSVVRLRKTDGTEVWRSELPKKGSSLITLGIEADALYASAGGELYRLHPDTGRIMWKNDLPGLGRGTVLIATAASSTESA